MALMHASLTRIGNLSEVRFDVTPLPRIQWATGDYVACRVLRPEGLTTVELSDGTRSTAREGDVVIGALGSRFATLEATGDWRRVGPDLRMEALTSAGLFGKATSVSTQIPPLLPLTYVGHVERGGKKVTMSDFVPEAEATALTAPVILLIGSSMSAGKTTSARFLIRALKDRNLRVTGTKVTGAGRYKDILAMKAAGADQVLDFVDAGLPSTVCSAVEYRAALRQMMAMIESFSPQVIVAEAGASPLEPYNGETAIEEIGPNIALTILCASDPYAVLGVTNAYHRKPDLVTGVAASTEAGVALVERLSGLRTMNFLDERSLPDLDHLIGEALRTYEGTRTEVRVHG